VVRKIQPTASATYIGLVGTWIHLLARVIPTGLIAQAVSASFGGRVGARDDGGRLSDPNAFFPPARRYGL